jgi:hypothetical protein
MLIAFHKVHVKEFLIKREREFVLPGTGSVKGDDVKF